MAPKRLTAKEKESIINLYRQPEESTTTLASRYGVSNSTISRILKQGLSDDEYESLVQQKRAGVFKSASASETDSQKSYASVSLSNQSVESPKDLSPQTAESDSEESLRAVSLSSGVSLRRRRSRADNPDDEPQQLPLIQSEEEDFSQPSYSETSTSRLPEKKVIPPPARHSQVVTSKPESESVDDDRDDDDRDDDDRDNDIGDEFDDDPNFDDELPSLIDDEFDDDLDDEEIDDEFDEDEDEDEDSLDDLDDDEGDLDDDEGEDEPLVIPSPRRLEKQPIQVLPIAEAQFPNICYLVVDRSSELIARPLREFTELGRIPAEDSHKKTLPIFDNHRVARRFSQRMQRIIKIPDGQVFQKVTPYLQAKGISHLLINGQLYAI